MLEYLSCQHIIPAKQFVLSDYLSFKTIYFLFSLTIGLLVLWYYMSYRNICPVRLSTICPVRLFVLLDYLLLSLHAIGLFVVSEYLSCQPISPAYFSHTFCPFRLSEICPLRIFVLSDYLLSVCPVRITSTVTKTLRETFNENAHQLVLSGCC